MSGRNRKVRKGDMTSPSPVTDGRTVWLLNGAGSLKAFDFKGNELWARDLQQDYGKWGLNHGYGSSPLLLDGALYIPVLHGFHTDDPLVRRQSGRQVREDAVEGRPPDEAIRESPDAYTTPVVARVGKAVEIVVSGGDIVTGHDPATRQGAVALARPEPGQQPVLSHHRVSARRRRHRLRADAREAARDQDGRPRRRHRITPALVRQGPRRADAGLRRQAALRR